MSDSNSKMYVIAGGKQIQGDTAEILENASKVKGRKFHLYLRSIVNMSSLGRGAIGRLHQAKSQSEAEHHARELAAMDMFVRDMQEALGLSDEDASEAVKIAMLASQQAGVEVKGKA